jgi:hypothetical protein
MLASQYKAIVLVAVLASGMQYVRPHSATALSIGWRPRRHHRRMGQKGRELHFAGVRFPVDSQGERESSRLGLATFLDLGAS